MKIIFIAERPTQIVTALAIAKQLNAGVGSEIIVAECFKGARDAVTRLSAMDFGISFALARSYDAAVDMAYSKLPARLFLHWDVGFGTHWRLLRLVRKNSGCGISVFEEGVGTYSDDIYPRLKRVVFQVMGLPVNVGGSRYVDNIYVYDVDLYKKSVIKCPPRVEKISTSLCQMLLNYEREFVLAFDAEFFIEQLKSASGRECIIFLSDWSFSRSELDFLCELDGVKLLKLHPHCFEEEKPTGFLVAPNALPAELLIVVASQLFAEVKVYHKGSSVPQYISLKNVSFKSLV